MVVTEVDIPEGAEWVLVRQSSGRWTAREGADILPAMRAVGRSLPRVEGVEKVTGRARYVDDLVFPSLLHAKTIRTTLPHSRFQVTLDPSFDWSRFTVVDARDIPGKNTIALIQDDQPCLAWEESQHAEEAVLLLAHEDREALEEAAAHVRIDAEPLPAVLTLDEAIAKQSRVFKRILIEKGDLDEGFRGAARVVEGTYRTGLQEQLYIENQGMIAVPGEDGSITVYGSMQCPYYVHKALKTLLALPPEKVRVVQTVTGGGFGGKEEYPSMVAAHAALLALKARRPVKLVYDRLEDIAATTKRHPSLVRIRSAVAADGTLLALDARIWMDGGAYMTLSPVVLSRGAIHAGGPYRWPHVRVEAISHMTNTPPNGAFRGFGAPQTLFAIENHMDRIAQELGIDPVALRRKNCLREGDSTITGQVLKGDVAAEEVLNEAVRRSGYEKKRKAFSRARGPVKKGIGLALYYHGAGFTGGGETYLASKVALEVTKDARVHVLAASTEIGQGTRTIFSQIVGEALGIPVEWVDVETPDTARVPDSGPTVASRTCMIIGGLIEKAARQVRQVLEAYGVTDGWSPKRFRALAKAYLEKVGPLKIVTQYETPREIVWNDETYKGDAYGAFAWAADVAEVEVDTVTGEVRCPRMTVVSEVGNVIHPVLAVGQIEGGTLQGVGWALFEQVVVRNGRYANAQLTNYIIPTSMDAPELDVKLLSRPYARGPFGAKGLGELPMDGPAPAIAAAMRHATGARFDELPILPESVLARLSKR